MRYILNPNIALRSWQLVPYAFYVKGERNAGGLKKEEFDFLSACDGKTEFPNEEESPLVEKFLAAGFISKAEKGETDFMPHCPSGANRKCATIATFPQ